MSWDGLPAPCMVCGSVTRRKLCLRHDVGERPWWICRDAAACRNAAPELAPL